MIISYLGYGDYCVGHTSPNIRTQHHRNHPEKQTYLNKKFNQQDF